MVVCVECSMQVLSPIIINMFTSVESSVSLSNKFGEVSFGAHVKGFITFDHGFTCLPLVDEVSPRTS